MPQSLQCPIPASPLPVQAEVVEDSNDRWVTSLREGDDRAFDSIIATWQKPLFAFAWRYVQNSAEACDLVAETFVRLHRKRLSLRADTRLSAWLFTTLANLCHNHHRWKKRHPTVSLDNPGRSGGRVETDALPHAEEEPPTTHMEREEDATALKQAIDQLPHDLKTALLLHHYEKLSYREIAGVVGCSERGVETRLYRARQRLRTALSGRLGN